jgi:hypothetical protein
MCGTDMPVRLDVVVAQAEVGEQGGSTEVLLKELRRIASEGSVIEGEVEPRPRRGPACFLTADASVSLSNNLLARSSKTPRALRPMFGSSARAMTPPATKERTRRISKMNDLMKATSCLAVLVGIGIAASGIMSALTAGDTPAATQSLVFGERISCSSKQVTDTLRLAFYDIWAEVEVTNIGTLGMSGNALVCAGDIVLQDGRHPTMNYTVLPLDNGKFRVTCTTFNGRLIENGGDFVGPVNYAKGKAERDAAVLARKEEYARREQKFEEEKRIAQIDRQKRDQEQLKLMQEQEKERKIQRENSAKAEVARKEQLMQDNANWKQKVASCLSSLQGKNLNRYQILDGQAKCGLDGHL